MGLYDPDEHLKAALSWEAIISLGLPPAAPFWVTLMIVAGIFALSIRAHLAYAQVFSTLAMAARGAVFRPL